MRTLVAIAVTAWSVTVFAQPKELAVPAPEVQTPATKVDLPAVPSFALPRDEPGFVSVQTLRVAGKKRFDTDVKVKGYITWVYDCATANAKRGESRAQTKKRIDDDPTLCERMKFYLGDAKNEAKERGLWVVEVPRPPNKLERERLPKEELASWPAVPKYKLGDYVVVTGKFAVSSPRRESHSDGLVVFQALEPANKSASTPRKASDDPPPARPTIAAPQTKQVIARAKDEQARQRSIKASNDGTRSYVLRKYAEAAAAYKQAIAEWPGNHVAYYGLAGAYIGERDWANARDAMARAHELEPNQAMYAMVYGYTQYEGAIADARVAQAKKQNVPPEAVTFDPSGINHDKALALMTHAIRLEPGLWRAHYYAGRIYRDRGDARWAAESLDAALRSAPTDPGPWVALGELYRMWQYTDQAIAVAKAGSTTVRPAESSDVWYVLGMAHDDKRNYGDAIAAFTKALDARPDHVKALFQRGQAYFAKRDFKRAKPDLEKFLATTAPGFDFPRQQANRMLMDIAGKQ